MLSAEQLPQGGKTEAKQNQNIMKLESLKSGKFKTMTNNQMNMIRGGYDLKTDGGGTYQGRPIVRDVHHYTDDGMDTHTGTIWFADGTSQTVKTT